MDQLLNGVNLCLCRTMLTKDAKPDEKGGGKGAMEVIPHRPDTPEMYKAALKVTEQMKIDRSLKKSQEPSEGTEVRLQLPSASLL